MIKKFDLFKKVCAISLKRFEIAQEAEKNSHILKKDINIFERRLSSAKQAVLPHIKHIESKLLSLSLSARSLYHRYRKWAYLSGEILYIW